MHLKSKDEIGTLGHAFNSMIEDLQKTTTSIDNLNVEVDERKKAEGELKRINKYMMLSNRRLEEFAYISSHDLREPVRRILAFGTLLSKSLTGRLSDDEQENLDLMLDGTDKMGQMVESLLTYWRITTGDMKFKEVDLNDLIQWLKDENLSTILSETGGAINIPENLPAVYADPVQMRQLSEHLIANALKYRKEGVRPEVIIRAHSKDDGTIRVEVQDNGTGITPEQFENIFSMFRRLNPREKSDGPGVGLTMCRRIIERHNGDIGVESEYGQGSTFWFTVPALQPSKQQQQLETANIKA
ncbi:MAG: HAMP domain-containing protein [Sedimentisphaerales bacterium]|nr:HAMP domain-containing protein [Sedimentisphaerales bacterium]